MNAFLGNPEKPVIDMFVVGRVVKRLLQAESDYERILKDARWLQAKFPGNTLDDAVSAYLDITRIITIIGGSDEFGHAHTEASHLVGMLAWLYAAALPITKSERSRLLAKRAELDEAYRNCNPADKLNRREQQIAASNFMRLHAAYSKRAGTINTIREQFAPGRNPVPLDCPENAAEQAGGIIRKLGTLRFYGVPSCIMQDGIMHDPDMCWAFYDGHAIMTQFPERFQRGLRIPHAATFLAERADISTLDTTFEPTGTDDELYTFGINFPIWAVVAIQTDGELTLDVEYGIYPLERAFKEADRAEFYGLFRLVHLMRLADLLIPETVRRRRKLRNWPTTPSEGGSESHRNEIEGLFREFWIPRQQVIYEEDLDAALNEDIQTRAERQPVSREDGEVRQLQGYFAPLREGASATERARQLSLKERGELPPPGYTYVRAHPHWYPGNAAAVAVARRRQRRSEE